MKVFIHILIHNISPIFILIFLGYSLRKKHQLDIFTLSKINFYILLPIFVLVNLYTTQISMDMGKMLVFALLLLVINSFAGTVVAKLRGYDDAMANAFKNTIMFYNSGNIGIPLMTLVFSSAPFIINGQTPYLETVLSAQVMVYVVQNITTNSIGFLNAGRANMHWKQCFIKVLKMPTLYVIPAAFALKGMPYPIEQTPLWTAFVYIKNAFVAMMLITLGIQLAITKFDFKNKEVFLSVFLRLIGGPLFSLVLIHLLGLKGIMAQAAFISSSTPTAVNAALIAVEFNNCPDYSSQVVMISTLLSAITLAMVVYTANLLFPIM